MRTPLGQLRRRVRGERPDAGVSLAELLVVSLVSSILLAALGVLFSGSLQATRRASTHTAATAEARLAMDAMARRLRVVVRPPTSTTAPPFTEATATSMTFWASLVTTASTADPAPSQVRYWVDATSRCLRETITTPSTGASRTQCLAFGDVAPVFTYYQVAKRPTLIAPSPSAVPTTPLPLTSTGLSATDAARVGSVEISLSVKDPRAAAANKPVNVSTRVLLVNWLNEETL